MFVRTKFDDRGARIYFNYGWRDALISHDVLQDLKIGRRTPKRVLAMEILTANLLASLISGEMYEGVTCIKLYKGKSSFTHGKRPVTREDLDWAIEMALHLKILSIYPGNQRYGMTTIYPTLAFNQYLPEGFSVDYNKFARVDEIGLQVPDDCGVADLEEERSKIDSINEVLSKYTYCYYPVGASPLSVHSNTPISLGIDHVALTRRIAKTKEPRLGRFSSPIQQMSKLERATIRIDGSKTADVDMRGAHAHMLYCIEGVNKEGDPYHIDGLPKEMRPVVKHATIVMLNCESRQEFIQNMRNNDVSSPSGSAKMRRKSKRLDFMGLSHSDFADQIEEHHKPIRHKLFAGLAAYLQSIEADIAGIVMSRLASLGKPSIGIHDSVIVKVDDAELAASFMREAYILVMRREAGSVYKDWCASISITLGT